MIRIHMDPTKMTQNAVVCMPGQDVNAIVFKKQQQKNCFFNALIVFCF